MPRGLASTLALLTLLFLAIPAVHAAFDPEVEAVQRELTKRGYSPGTIDGAMGRRTRTALREFQRSAGIPDTGRVDDATRAVLGLVPRTGAKRPVAEGADSTGADDTARTEPAAESDAAAPKTEQARTGFVIAPETDAANSEAAGSAPAAVPDPTAPKAEPTRSELVIVPETDAAKAEPSRAEPATVADTVTPSVEPTRTEPATVRDSTASRAEAARSEPAPASQTLAPIAEAARAESTPVRTPRLKLDFATLGWHRPQTGSQALARFDAIGAPPEFRRGTGTLFVPKGEFVFVLKAGERLPGFDCDPGAGRLSIEFVFGPDGPVIFTPIEGGEFCQTGIGIAIEVGRTMEIQRVDWGDTQLPPGTVRVTGQGLEYVR